MSDPVGYEHPMPRLFSLVFLLCAAGISYAQRNELWANPRLTMVVDSTIIWFSEATDGGCFRPNADIRDPLVKTAGLYGTYS